MMIAKKKKAAAKPRAGGAKVLNSSIEGLVKKFGSATPEDAIRQAAREVITFARSLGWQGPPFDMRLLASILGIKERAVRELAQDALIMPARTGDGFEIFWKDGVPDTRTSFTIGHEIAHTFFPDCAEAIRYRQPLHRCDPQKPVEVLCDLGAAELLLPLPEFRRDVERHGASLATVDLLRTLYQASREAVALRMVRLATTPCAAVFLTRRLKPAEIHSSRQLTMSGFPVKARKFRVDMMVVSESFGLERLPVHKSVPEDSCIYLLSVSTTGFAEGIERWDGGRAKFPRLRISALSIPPNGSGEERAMVLLRRDS